MTDQRTHYYAARKVPDRVIGWNNAQNYGITFVFSDTLYRVEGVYIYEASDPYYLHRISWVEFDLLTAFDVPSTIGFKPIKLVAQSNSWDKKDQ
jgi:hypothetical protein